MKKIIMVNSECDNCGDCVKACMELHKISRIAILEHEDRYLPVICQHCASAPSKEVCPVEASLIKKLELFIWMKKNV